MTGEQVERRLAAVLSADVAGYRRLMGRDEVGTLANLKLFRKSLVDPAISAQTVFDRNQGNFQARFKLALTLLPGGYLPWEATKLGI